MKSRKTFQCYKILFFDHSTQIGGAEKSLIDIICGIQHIEGFEPIFVGANSICAELKFRGIKCISFRIPAHILRRTREHPFRLSDIYELPILIFQFLRILRQERPHLVYTNTQKAHFIGLIAARLVNIPRVCHFRDILPRNTFTKLWLKIIYKFSTQIIAISKAVAREFRGERKIKIVYNGIKIQKREVRSQKSKVKRVGYVGQIARWKGIEYFIEAMSIINKKFEQTNFLIIGGPIFGDFDYLNELKAFSHSLNLDDKVTFTGWVSSALPYIAQLDILIHPPVQAEPFGRVLIEAGALGKPVVATKCGAIPEIIKDGATGILVPRRDSNSIADAVSDLLADEEKKNLMGKRARKRVATHFRVENMIQEVTEIIKESIG